MAIKKELNALQKDITDIGKRVEKLLKAVEKSGEAKVARAPKAKPAKKTTKAPAKKKAVKGSATDLVLKIVNRSKKGVDTATLMKKTGFNQKKVTNILQRTYKQGRIKRVDKGIYVGVK